MADGGFLDALINRIKSRGEDIASARNPLEGALGYLGAASLPIEGFTNATIKAPAGAFNEPMNVHDPRR